MTHMPMTVLGVVVGGLLAACASPMPVTDQKRDVRLITYKTVVQVDRACRDAGYKALPFPVTLIEGCVVYTDTTCTIHARTPSAGSDTNAFRVLGHETMHCFTGDWHHDRQEVVLGPTGAPSPSVSESRTGDRAASPN